MNIITNAFYNFPHNYGEINTNQYNIINKIFTPNKTFKNEINKILEKLEVEKKNIMYYIFVVGTS